MKSTEVLNTQRKCGSICIICMVDVGRLGVVKPHHLMDDPGVDLGVATSVVLINQNQY